jgi:hypothetical protein
VRYVARVFCCARVFCVAGLAAGGWGGCVGGSSWNASLRSKDGGVVGLLVGSQYQLLVKVDQKLIGSSRRRCDVEGGVTGVAAG